MGYHYKAMNEAKEARKTLQEQYAKESFDKSGYMIGQMVPDEDGKIWFVAGAFVSGEDVYLELNFAKKDGTMSKVSGIGRGMPRIKIA